MNFENLKRREFLTEFLGALGAESIVWRIEDKDLISGVVVYDSKDLDEIQEFCWRSSEENVPNEHVFKLVKLINKNNFLDIDKIIIKRKELLSQFNKTYALNITDQDFISILNELKEIEVSMVDDGKETDVYFIHE